jgi:hypothetical protein
MDWSGIRGEMGECICLHCGLYCVTDRTERTLVDLTFRWRRISRVKVDFTDFHQVVHHLASELSPRIIPELRTSQARSHAADQHPDVFQVRKDHRDSLRFNLKIAEYRGKVSLD